MCSESKTRSKRGFFSQRKSVILRNKKYQSPKWQAFKLKLKRKSQSKEKRLSKIKHYLLLGDQRRERKSDTEEKESRKRIHGRMALIKRRLTMSCSR